MKKTLALLICIIFCTCVYAQVTPARLDSLHALLLQDQPGHFNIGSVMQPNGEKAATPHSFFNSKKAKQPKPALSKKYASAKRVYTCYDSSFTKLFGLTNQWAYVLSMLHTSDDGVLISGEMFDTTYKNPSWHTNGYILKTDKEGNIQWLQQFADAGVHKIYNMYPYKTFELSNKDIIAVGTIDTLESDYRDVTVVFRLDRNGNLLWYTPFTSSLTKHTSGISVDLKTVAEGLNGDLIFGGSTYNNTGDGNIETVLRMDASGKIIWDANFSNIGDYRGGAEGFGAFVINGNVVLCGQSFGEYYSNTPPAINFVTLDYATGNTISKVFTVPDFSDVSLRFEKDISSYTGKCLRLANGHIMVYGQTYGPYLSGRDTTDQFTIMEFDSDYNVVDASTIYTVKATNIVRNFIDIDRDKNLMYSFARFGSDTTYDVFLSQEENNQVVKSRKIYYSKIGNAGSYEMVKFNDQSYAYIQSHFDLKEGVKSYIEFKRLHNSDTTSECLGSDTLFAKHQPLPLKPSPNYYMLDDNLRNKIKEADYKVNVTDTVTYRTENGCEQQNICDTVSIHGNSNICGSDKPVVFTAYKSSYCGAFVQWNIDTSIIESMQQLNDTTVSIQFKNVNWNGYLYAMLPPTKCFAGIPSDSFKIHVVQVNQQLDLGPDTMLCGSSTSLLLHAGTWFKTYEWQDGSSDSTLTVTAAGKYYVTATDYCGNLHSDTIQVTKADYVFGLGNDTTKCNNDTLVLTASAGFTDYKWQPEYNLYHAVNNTVQVYPFTDTAYTVSAKKSGCNFYDTILVSVLHSTPVLLGNDTSICYGSFLQLNAGQGFKQYQWNTGASTATINVDATGSYSVHATALNNCVSSDMLSITAIKPLPVFSLGSDTALCKNQSLDYSFNLSNATYAWSTGSNSNKQTIVLPGEYQLTVVQNLCNATDTVIVYQKPSPEVNLGNDTILCAGDTFILNASYNNATYMWQDGTTSPRYSVSKPGLYSVVVTLDECTASDSIRITYNSNPVFNLGKDTAMCNGTEILLQPVLNTIVSYRWQNGSGLPYYNVQQPGLYYLTATNNCGTYTDSLKVDERICDIILPSAFTPNHDGLNDEFKIKYPPPVKSYNMVIYNRWGQLVFVSNNIGIGWDGNYKGFPVSQDSFVWMISVTDINGRITNMRGTVTVIK